MLFHVLLIKGKEGRYEELLEFSSNLECLVDSKECFDVLLNVKGSEKQVRTLRAFLLARSPVFKKQLQAEIGKRETQSGPVELEIDASYAATLAAVRWITTVSLDLNLDNHFTDICDLLILADRYQLEGLKNCVKENYARNSKRTLSWSYFFV
jgi:hypothetical protein